MSGLVGLSNMHFNHKAFAYFCSPEISSEISGERRHHEILTILR